MEISSYPSSTPLPPSKPGAAAARGKDASASRSVAATPSSPALSLNVFEPIQQAMNNCPDSRAEVVARGKALAADPNYPPAEVVGQLARLFVTDGEASFAAS